MAKRSFYSSVARAHAERGEPRWVSACRRRPELRHLRRRSFLCRVSTTTSQCPRNILPERGPKEGAEGNWSLCRHASRLPGRPAPPPPSDRPSGRVSLPRNATGRP